VKLLKLPSGEVEPGLGLGYAGAVCLAKEASAQLALKGLPVSLGALGGSEEPNPGLGVGAAHCSPSHQARGLQ